MIGFIIAAIAALAFRSQSAAASPSTPSGTIVTVGTPTFGSVPTNAGNASVLSREPGLSTIAAWQNGPTVPVPTGSSQDYIATGAARSDSAVGQATGLQVINPNMGDSDDKNKNKVYGAPASGGGAPASGGVAPTGGGSSGGSINIGYSGGFGGGRLRGYSTL